MNGPTPPPRVCGEKGEGRRIIPAGGGGARMTAPPPADATGGVAHLVDRRPTVSPERLIAQLTPPPTFAEASFGSYHPDPAEPTQSAAVAACQQFCRQAVERRGGRKKLFGRREVVPGIGLY